MHLRWSLFMGLAFIGSLLFAQSMNDKPAPLRLGLKYGAGFMITHSPIMEYVSEQHFSKLEIYGEKQLTGSKDWHQRYGFPFAGMTFSRFNFYKDEFFGNAYSLSPYYSFFLLKGKKLDVKLRNTLGLGWIEKEFDLENNHKNVAIGSHLNIYFSVLVETDWKVAEQWALNFGLNYSHFSNTSFQTPNLGINLPSAELGLTYQLGGNPTLKSNTDDRSDESEGQSNFFQIRGGFGVNENYPVNGPKFIATAFSFEWENEISRKSNWGSGLDLYYNPAQKAKLAGDSIDINGGWQNLQIGLSAHYLMKFGKLKGGVKVGYYLKKEDDDLRNTYQEVYGQHIIYRNLSGFVSIKTHLAKAEYFLFGLKYSLK